MSKAAPWRSPEEEGGCCETPQVDSFGLFESWSPGVWLWVLVQLWIAQCTSICPIWRDKSKCQTWKSPATVLIFWHINCYVIFTGPPWRVWKCYTVAWKNNIKQDFCFCSRRSLYPFTQQVTGNTAVQRKGFSAKSASVIFWKLSLAISVKLLETDSRRITSWTQHSQHQHDTHAKVILV